MILRSVRFAWKCLAPCAGTLSRGFLWYKTWRFSNKNTKRSFLVLGCYFDWDENHFPPLSSISLIVGGWLDPHYSELHLGNFLVIVAFELMCLLRNSKLILSGKSSKNCKLEFWWFFFFPLFLKEPRVREHSAKWCAGGMGCIPSPCVSLLGCCWQKDWCNFCWN